MELVAHEETVQTDPQQMRVWKRMMIMRMMEKMIFNRPTNHFQVSSEWCFICKYSYLFYSRSWHTTSIGKISYFVDDDNLMGGHRHSTNIRSSIKARGPPGPIHSIQQQSPSVPPTNVVDNGHDRMVMKITSGGGSRSGSPTPRNSPKSTHQILEEYQLQPHQVTLFCINSFYVSNRFIK